VQTEYTAPPGSIVIVGDEGKPQGMNRSAVTVKAAVAWLAVIVSARAGETLTAPVGSLATVTDQSTSQSPLPLPLRSIRAPAPFGATTSAVPPGGYSDSVPGVGVGRAVGDGVGEGDGLAVLGAGLGVVADGLAVGPAGVVGAAAVEGAAVLGAVVADAAAVLADAVGVGRTVGRGRV
jgi:hypothetical protein